MKIVLGNRDAAMAEPIDLRIDGAGPRAQIDLNLTLVDEIGEEWRSHAVFEASSTNMFNIAHSPSLGGTYRGVDAAGLMWSALPPRRLRSAAGRSRRNGARRACAANRAACSF